MLLDTPREVPSTSSAADKTAPYASGTLIWGPRSRYLRRTDTRCSPSQCECIILTSQLLTHELHDIRSHDNAKFASSGGDRSVFVWDVTTGVTSRRLPGHTGKVFSVEFNADATVLASGKYLFISSSYSITLS